MNTNNYTIKSQEALQNAVSGLRRVKGNRPSRPGIY